MTQPGSKKCVIIATCIATVILTAHAKCTGIPTQCVLGEKSVCEDILGCEWKGGTSFFLDGYCEGTPIPCEQLSDETRLRCLKHGCSYEADDPVTTPAEEEEENEDDTEADDPPAEEEEDNDDTNETFCTGAPFPTPQCSGSPTSECNWGDKGSCKGIIGCYWVGHWLWGHCEGTATPCDELTKDTCEKQTGCHYFEDPPNPEESFYDAIMPLDADFDCSLPVSFTSYDYYFEVVDEFTKIVCEKCRPSRDGEVCYTEVSYWSLWRDSIVSHLCNMDVGGGNYCECEFCEDGSTAFNCGHVVAVEGPDARVVGHDCFGNCIWKNPD